MFSRMSVGGLAVFGVLSVSLLSAPQTRAADPLDITPPHVAIRAPANGAVASGVVSITADASDAVGISRVDFIVDTNPIGSATAAPYSISWDTSSWPLGDRVLLARAIDSAGNEAYSEYVVVTVAEASTQAVYDAPLGAPFAPGKTVKVEVTIWAWAGYTSDRLDLYCAGNATSPQWTFLRTLSPTRAGQQVLSTTYVLPSGPQQVLRARLRYGGSATSACVSGAYNDHDDLIF